MIVNLSTQRIGDITATNIYKSFTHKMAAKTGWYRCGKNYVTVCINVLKSLKKVTRHLIQYDTIEKQF